MTCGSTREVCDGVDNNCNAMIDEGAGCVRTIDVTTWTPDHACLSTYDDFRSGPDYLCQQMGYARSTGTFQCDPISCITDPAYVCTLVDARHNGGWFYDISGTTYGEGWCVGMSCVSSIQCVIP